ncbi:MAG: caspase family protein [Candidatus Kapabacteria bacterium]|nr:caspase family protein [Candidatus Kapabacteria bacterium]
MTVAGKDSLIVYFGNGTTLLCTPDKQERRGARVNEPESVTSIVYDPISKSILYSLVSGRSVTASFMKYDTLFRDTFQLHDSKIICMNTLTTDASTAYMITGGQDGKVSFVNLRNTDLQYFGYPVIRENGLLAWVVYSNDQYYDAFDIDREYLRYVSGTDAYSIDELNIRYHVPRILSQLGNAKRKQAELREIKQPPLIRFINSFQNPLHDSVESVLLTVQFTIRQTGMSRIMVYRGNTLVRNEEVDVPDDIQCTHLRTYTIELLPDTNTFIVQLFDNDSTVVQKELTVISMKRKKNPKLYVLSIGVNSYKDATASLKYAVNDAREIAKVFQEQYSSAYETAVVQSITDANATIEEVRTAFKKLQQQITPNDGFIFFFAGHGVNVRVRNDAKYVLALHGISNFNNSDGIIKDGLLIDSLAALLTTIQSKNTLVLLDACFAGKAFTAFDPFASVDKQVHTMQRNTKSIVLASVNAESKAKESDTIQHGIFTYMLLKGLTTSGSDSGGVDIFDLQRSLARPVDGEPHLSQKPLKADSNIELRDFALTRTR